MESRSPPTVSAGTLLAMTYNMDDHEPTDHHPDRDCDGGSRPRLPDTIRTQAELEATWRHLMEPLGFGGYSIWMLLITADGEPIPHLTQIEDVPEVLAPEEFASLADIAKDVIGEVAPGGRVAFLRTRPGRDTASHTDRELASGLLEACRRITQPIEVVHFANDVLLAPLPLDELPLSASA